MVKCGGDEGRALLKVGNFHSTLEDVTLDGSICNHYV